MRNILTITGKEIKTYFASPMAYVVAAVFLVINGYFFVASLSGAFPEATIRGFIFPSSFVLMFLTPLLTMRLFAEEAKMGTLELLLTAPVQDYQVVVGKFFASLAILAIMVALTGYFAVLLFIYGDPDAGPILSGFLGTLLLGAAFLSVGVFASSLTSNQIVAAVVAFGLLLLLWVINGAGSLFSGIPREIFDYLAPPTHFRDFAFGVIDTKDVIYFLSLSAAFLLFTVQSVGTRRWR
ncbi:MAG: ABC transporter permease subunit [Chloroflexi bacterium]|nr:ABC transporter permease subunit [Chloroflexota bacterium]